MIIIYFAAKQNVVYEPKQQKKKNIVIKQEMC